MRRPWAILLGGVWAAAAAAPAADIPSWLRETAALPHPSYLPQTKAVVLLNERRVQVEVTGRQTTTTRRVIKVLTLEGKAEARAGHEFDSKDSKIREMRAWLIQPTGKTREFGKKDMVESSLSSVELYSSYRSAGASVASEIDPGGVFGFESVLEEKSVFTQYSFAFQTFQPHLLSRFQLTVPEGWRAEAKSYSGAPDKPSVQGSTFIWEARDLALVEREPGAPAESSLLPRIRVSLVPPTGQASAALPTFSAWPDVSLWVSRLGEAVAEVTPSVQTQAATLFAGKTTAWDRVRAVAEFAQGIRYVAISTNISKGGGLVPHTADQVLANRYGDCKDKANLMKALLRVAGIESWLVTIYSGDPYFTQPDWPSPQQFNHAILAIAMPDAPAVPAALAHPTLGRLLLFDPTDDSVPLGYLPLHEQGAYALVLAGARGDLLKMPQTAPEQNHTERRWEITLAPDGSIAGTLEEISTGQDAFDAAALDRELAESQNQRLIQGRLNFALPGVELRDVARNYDAANRRHRLTLGFRAPGYARVMKGKLWMVRSVPMTYDEMPNVNRPQRRHALVLRSASFTESIQWNLPERLTVDELPDSISAESDWGQFRAEWQQSPRQIRVKRTLALRPQIVPASRYQAARQFMMQFNGAELAPFVLMAP